MTTTPQPAAHDFDDDKPGRKRRRWPGAPAPAREHLTRAEVLSMVPLCMTSINNLEKRGIFPSRFRLEPTTRVVWSRREVEQFLKRHAKRVRPESAA